MKFPKYIYNLLGAAALLTALNSCENLTDGYSTDPVEITDPSVISTPKFLNGVQVNLIGAYEADVNRLTGMWSGEFSGEDRQYVGLSNYNVANRDFNNEWATIYGVHANSLILRERARVEKNPRIMGITQVMDAMAIGLAADLWGDVPFSEAGLFPSNITPKYDAQADVYAAVQTMLDSAIVNLALPVPSVQVPGNEDSFFGGDDENWTRVANTLKARFYLHTKDYTRAIAYSDPAIAINSGDGNMVAPHGNVYLQNFNLYYSFLSYDRPGYMAANAYAPTLLDADKAGNRNNAKTNEQARLWFYYLPGGGGNFGPGSVDYEPNVISTDFWGSDFASSGFFGADSPFPMVTYEETLLIRAEAFAKNNASADALDALNELRAYFRTGANLRPGFLPAPGGSGFSQAFEVVDENEDYVSFGLQYDDYDMADFEPGGIANVAGQSGDQSLLIEILEERYISLTGQLELFNDIRRTKNILNIPLKNNATKFPQRLLYSQDEINSNTKNVPSNSVGFFDETPVNKTAY